MADLREFYIAVHDGPKKGLLLGPYATKGEALANMIRAKTLAEQRDPFSCFYGYGLAAAKPGSNLKTIFGK